MRKHFRNKISSIKKTRKKRILTTLPKINKSKKKLHKKVLLPNSKRSISKKKMMTAGSLCRKRKKNSAKAQNPIWTTTKAGSPLRTTKKKSPNSII